MSTLPTLNSQIQTPVDTRWLWALRGITLGFLILSFGGALEEIAAWEEVGPVVLWTLCPVLVHAAIFWGLRSNPPSKFCLAVIVAIGSILFVLLGFGSLLDSPGPLAHSARDSGGALKALMWVGLAFAEGGYGTVGIRVYYLMKRESGDPWKLLRAFVLVGVGGLALTVIASGPIRQKQRALEQNAVVALQLINAAEMEYAKTYGHGFSPTLEALGAPAAGTLPNAGAANLALPAIEGGIRLGYRLAYTPSKPDPAGYIAGYSLSARPVRYRRETRRSFYTDQTGVIRSTKEDREAAVQDPPYRGN